MKSIEANQAGAPNDISDKISSAIMDHVSNSSLDHPILHLPTIFGINFSVTKHVMMLWVTAVVVFSIAYFATKRYRKEEYPVPTGFTNAFETVVDFIRNQVVRPNIGAEFSRFWAPLILTLFFFILTANTIGLIPIFEFIGGIARFVYNISPNDDHHIVNRLLHGGATATGNFNVTAGLATVTFFGIIVAGSLKHGFLGHWKNLAPPGQPFLVYIILIPIEIIAMFVKPFALTMRLAANMTGGHIAILSIMSFIFIFGDMFSPTAGIAVGALVSVPLNVAISGLEIIVILIQAYVFTLLTAIFIGMSIHPHH